MTDVVTLRSGQPEIVKDNRNGRFIFIDGAGRFSKPLAPVTIAKGTRWFVMVARREVITIGRLDRTDLSRDGRSGSGRGRRWLARLF